MLVVRALIIALSLMIFAGLAAGIVVTVAHRLRSGTNLISMLYDTLIMGGLLLCVALVIIVLYVAYNLN